MIRLKDLMEVRNAELLPQATINKPVSYFVEHLGANLVRGEDDLDFFEGVGLVLDDIVPFALMHYRGYPPNTTTVYLPFGIQGASEIAAIVSKIAKETDINPVHISWQRA